MSVLALKTSEVDAEAAERSFYHRQVVVAETLLLDALNKWKGIGNAARLAACSAEKRVVLWLMVALNRAYCVLLVALSKVSKFLQVSS